MRIEIATDRPGLILRQLAAEDSLPLFELISRNRPHLSQHLDTTSERYPDHESVLNNITDSKRPGFRFGIWDNDELVGCASLHPVGLLAELGYWVSADRTRRGYASHASRALCRYARETVELRRVIAFVHKDNDASQGVLTRCGFACRGMAHKSETALVYMMDV